MIFIIEDDPQDGFDHVDGHRSVCMVVSPYTKRNQTISTFYNQPGLVHTMEQILGVLPMNQMDAIGPLMTDCFTPIPDCTPFESITSNLVNLAEVVPPLDKMSPKQRYWAEQSMKLDFSRPDRADPVILSHINWFASRGNAPYPTKYANSNGKSLKKLGLIMIKGNDSGDDD